MNVIYYFGPASGVCSLEKCAEIFDIPAKDIESALKEKGEYYNEERYGQPVHVFIA